MSAMIYSLIVSVRQKNLTDTQTDLFTREVIRSCERIHALHLLYSASPLNLLGHELNFGIKQQNRADFTYRWEEPDTVLASGGSPHRNLKQRFLRI